MPVELDERAVVTVEVSGGQPGVGDEQFAGRTDGTRWRNAVDDPKRHTGGRPADRHVGLALELGG